MFTLLQKRFRNPQFFIIDIFHEHIEDPPQACIQTFFALQKTHLSIPFSTNSLKQVHIYLLKFRYFFLFHVPKGEHCVCAFQEEDGLLPHKPHWSGSSRELQQAWIPDTLVLEGSLGTTGYHRLITVKKSIEEMKCLALLEVKPGKGTPTCINNMSNSKILKTPSSVYFFPREDHIAIKMCRKKKTQWGIR